MGNLSVRKTTLSVNHYQYTFEKIKIIIKGTEAWYSNKITYKMICNGLKNAVHGVLFVIELGPCCGLLRCKSEIENWAAAIPPLSSGLLTGLFLPVCSQIVSCSVSLCWLFSFICILEQWKIDATCSWASVTKRLLPCVCVIA